MRLPEAMREEMRRPMGRLVDGKAFGAEVKGMEDLVTVGDFCTAEALAAGARPKVAVVDRKVERQEDGRAMEHPFTKKATRVKVENPAAHLSPEVWEALQEAYAAEGPTLIDVEGEEDLVALPAIALAPDGFTVAYGMPGEGVVLVRVDAEARARAEEALSRMEVVHGG